ncbi:MAG: hypothetical protein IJ996_03455 [Clostridia bacterium]|nr:hypothetical protein [Clostridia bacterium]
MDAKITKQRIGRMLSYDWIKIVAVIAAVILGWSLVFTTTATRIQPWQEFTVFSYSSNVPLDDGYYTRQQGILQDGVFSYETIETHTYDLSTQKDMAHTMLQTRLSTNEGDVLFLPNAPDATNPVEKDEQTTYPRTYVQAMLSSYPSNFFDIEKYLQGMDEYLDEYYGGDHTTGTLDEDKVKQAFLDRVKANKDKRFKTEKQKQAGALDEVERIRKYKTAYDEFTGFLQDGIVTLETVTAVNPDGTVIKNETTDEPALEGKFALNLCPDVTTMGKLSNWYSYVDETVEKPAMTSKNMCVMFFDMYDVDDSYEYESLVYVTYIIKDCYTPVQNG